MMNRKFLLHTIMSTIDNTLPPSHCSKDGLIRGPHVIFGINLVHDPCKSYVSPAWFSPLFMCIDCVSLSLCLQTGLLLSPSHAFVHAGRQGARVKWISKFESIRTLFDYELGFSCIIETQISY